MLYFSIILLGFVSTFLEADCQVLSVELNGGPSEFHKMLMMRGPDYVKNKFAALMDGNATIPLSKWLDVQYFGEALIGHPGQKFKFVFDTSWATVWVPSVLCSVLDLACQNHNRYDHSHSSTYIPNGKTFEILFTDYKLKGFYSTDLFHLGQVNVTNQTFGEVTSMPKEFYFYSNDGIIGLAFKSISPDNITPLFDNLIAQKVISKKIFSFYFNRARLTTKGGSLYLGGSLSKHYRGNFTYVPLAEETYWAITVDSISVYKNDTYFCQNCEVILDSSSNDIAGPAQAIQDLSLMIKATSLVFGRYMVDCGSASSLPQIEFKIGGESFILKGRDYVEKLSWHGITLCLSAFRENGHSPPPYDKSWTLGAAFLARYYTEFDGENNRVGFAEVR